MSYIYLSVEIAKEVVRRSRVISKYSEYGARCPLCGSWGKRIHKCVRTLSSGKKRRYFICPDCTFKFSAE